MTFRLLILSDYPSPEQEVSGGIPRCVHSIVSEFAEVDHSIEIYVTSISSKVKNDVVQNSDNVTIHYIPFPVANYPIIIPKLLTSKIIQREIRKIKPDIIHVQGINKHYIYPIFNQDSYATVLTVHGIIHQESKSWTGLLGKYRAYVGKHLENRVLNCTKNIIAVSPYVKRTIAPMTNGEITVIYNALEEKFFSVKNDEVVNQILFVGGIEERKGLHILIDSIEKVKKNIPDIKLHIVGGIRKRTYFDTISKQIADLNLQDSIIFKSHLSDPELMQEYSEASLFVLPSKEESLGIVLLEAMATGTPVVASNIGGIPDIIKNGKNGYLVNYGDSQTMASSIEELLLDKKLRDEMGITGREMAKNYVPKRIAMEHINVYKKIFSP